MQQWYVYYHNIFIIATTASFTKDNMYSNYKHIHFYTAYFQKVIEINNVKKYLTKLWNFAVS